MSCEHCVGSPPGVGKTHLAISLAIAAAQFGRKVYYGTLADLITSLEEAQAAGRLTHRLKTLTYPPVLVVDEIGFRPLNRVEANLFFRLVSSRYEKGSIVLTSNKHVRDWPEIFAGDEILTTAILDHLLHHVHIVHIDGRSYRLRELDGLFRQPDSRSNPQARKGGDANKQSVGA